MNTQILWQKLSSMIHQIVFWTATFFITFGSGLLLLMAVNEIVFTNNQGLPANLVSTTDVSIEKKTDAALSPSVFFVSETPSQVRDSFDVTIEATSIDKLRLRLRGLSVVYTRELTPKLSQKNTHSFTVSVADLKPGSYQIEAVALNLTGDQFITQGPKFEVVLDRSTETSVITKTTTNTDFYELETSNSTEDFAVKLRIGTSVITTDSVPLVITTSQTADSVAIYAQKEGSSEIPRFVGAAREVRTNEWLLAISTKNFENAVYQFSATAIRDDIKAKSNMQQLTVSNPILTDEQKTANEEALPATPSEIEITKHDSEPLAQNSIAVNEIVSPGVVRRVESADPVSSPEPVRATIDTVPNKESNTIRANNVSLVTSTDIVVRRVLQDNQASINQQIAQFIAENDLEALQSVNQRQTLQTAILETLFRDQRLRSISDDAKAMITREVEAVINRAIEFQISLQQLDTESAELDIMLRELAESVEITESTVTDVTSPREFGVVREDLFTIESVSPVVVTDESGSTSTVFTEITGRTIPNGRVSLFIYSSPVIVTVTAGPDGTFTYLYENELEDGEHEVYVALTNTAGAVVAKSNGFRFIKEAQAFTIVDDVTGDALVPIANTTSDANSYMSVLALSIVALGALLLVLGTNLRRRTPVIHENT